MENARLLDELLRQSTRSLEYQTATADVLKAINAVAGRPDSRCWKLWWKAAQLCDAAYGYDLSTRGSGLPVMASLGLPAEFAADPRLQGVMQFTTAPFLDEQYANAAQFKFLTPTASPTIPRCRSRWAG